MIQSFHPLFTDGESKAIVKGRRTVMKSGPRLLQLEKALARNEDPTQPKINNKVAIN